MRTKLRLQFLPALLLLALFGTAAYGQTITVDRITYSVSSTNLEAISTTNTGAVTIPKTVPYAGSVYTVTSIGNDAFRNKQLTSVSIPESVTDIKYGAFRGNQLTSVTIHDTVTSIGTYAFAGNQLTNVTIPNSVTSIGRYTFQYNQLTHVTIPNSVTSIGEGAFLDNQLTRVTVLATTPPTFSGVDNANITDPFPDRNQIDLFVPDGSVADYEDLGDWDGFASISEIVDVGDEFEVEDITYEITSLAPYRVTATGYIGAGTDNITIPDNVDNGGPSYTVTSIGSYAFSNIGLTSVTIGDNVESIGAHAFWLNSLTSVDIGDNVTSIGEGAFQTNQLPRVVLPASVTSIGILTFQGNSITFVTALGTAPPPIGDDTFSRRGDITVFVPAGSVADYEAAAVWQDFKSITAEEEVGHEFTTVDRITYKVTEIDPNNTVEVIDYIGSSTSVEIPETVLSNRDNTYTVTSIGNRAFMNNHLTSVELPGGLTTIVEYAFWNNDNLTHVTIPAGVTDIEQGVFGNMDNLVQVTVLADSPPSIQGADPFNSTTSRGNIDLIVPVGSVADYEDHGDWDDFASISEIVDVGDEFEVEDITYEITSLAPYRVTATGYIGAGTDNITIPDNVDNGGPSYTVTSIGSYAFQSNSLTHVTLGRNVADIGIGAFDDNSTLTTLTVLNSIPPDIDTDAFDEEENIDVIVPLGSVAAYEAHEDWAGFKSFTEALPFTTTWMVGDNAYGDGDLTVTIPTTGSGYDFTVDWGDNSTPTTHVGSGANLASHEYPSADTYTIRIHGDFPRIYFNNGGDKDKITAVTQWGDIQWQSMHSAFYGCSNLDVTANDAPDLQNVTSMESMFRASEFNRDISHWTVDNVENMANMFRDASSFNQDISSWNVGNVERMDGMFWDASSFNADISGWNVGEVTTMNQMFNGATNFNNGGEPMNWGDKTSKVTDMHGMFASASSFNADIGNWDVSSVTNIADMFISASDFDQDIGGWDIGQVTNMVVMLHNSGLSIANYNATLEGWANASNTPSNVTLGAGGLEYDCFGKTYRDELTGTYGWTISNDTYTDCDPFTTTWIVGDADYGDGDLTVTIPTTGSGYNYTVDWGDGTTENNQTGNAEHPYTTAGTYTIKIYGDFPMIFFNNGSATDKNKLLFVNAWGDIQWQSMGRAFYGCTHLDVTAPDAPNLENVTDMHAMFNGTSLTGTATNLNSWNVANVEDMGNMFNGASVFNPTDISAWNVGQVTSMYQMFNGASAFNADISGWDVSNVTTMYSMFNGASAFNKDIGGWDVGKVQSMSFMFNGASAFNADISGWDVGEVTTMYSMFSGASAFNKDIGGWDVGKVQSMSFMFNGASAFNQDIGDWDVSQVTNMVAMFQFASSFTGGNIGNWADKTSQVKNMSFMFYGATAFNTNISNWNVENVTNMSWMFSGASAFDQGISGWEVGQVQSMRGMFANVMGIEVGLGTTYNGDDGKYYINEVSPVESSFNQDLSGWADKTGNVTDMYGMFHAATAFDQDLGGWDIGQVTDMALMLDNSGLSIANYNATLEGWANASNTPTAITLGAGGLEYDCDGKAYRDILTSSPNNWTILNDTDVCTLSINNEVFSNTISVSPNPVTSVLTINGSAGFELKQATVYTIMGKQLLSTTSTTLNTSSLSSGLYLLKIENTQGQIAIKKIVKQ